MASTREIDKGVTKSDNEAGIKCMQLKGIATAWPIEIQKIGPQRRWPGHRACGGELQLSIWTRPLSLKVVKSSLREHADMLTSQWKTVVL
jgi:hypothetical protein